MTERMESDLSSGASSHAADLRDSVADFVNRGTSIARVRGLRGTKPGYERAVGAQMAELGWLGILVPEDCGGLGLGCAEMAIVAEGLARAVVPEPLNAAAVLAAVAIAHADNKSLRRELLEGLVAGSLIPAVAWQEAAGTLDAGSAMLRADPHGTGYRLNGVKNFIAGAAGADGFVVSAQTERGLALFWIAAGAQGATLQLQLLADGTYMGKLTLANVAAAADSMLASPQVAVEALQRALDSALVIASAELFGVMAHALDMSVEYMKTRAQFGKKIGSFQAVAALDSDVAPNQRSLIASRAKARCSDAGLRITREAIQMHGAIGFTDEYDLGLYVKRALVLAAWLGNAALHRRRYARLIALEQDGQT